MSIEVSNISKTFGGTFKALNDVSLRIDSGELVALLGPSGSGKTTLLRIMAGLETPDEPKDPEDQPAIRFMDEDVTEREIGQRRVGFVFQHYALFRHMTVFDNVAFGLRVRPRKLRPGRAKISERVMELLRLVQLEPLAKRYPNQLSGGQRQRVALARALAVEPKVLLLDEPFGALDAKVRRELRRWLRHLHEETKITTVFVTHDQEEALEVADRICVLNQGRIEQVGTPDEVYEKPATPFVYNFLGSVNLFHARVDAGQIKVGGMEFKAPGWDRTGKAVAYVRPHDLDITRTPDENTIPATVEHTSVGGPVVTVTLKRTDDGSTLEAQLPRDRFKELSLKQGEAVHVALKNARVFTEDYSI